MPMVETPPKSASESIPWDIGKNHPWQYIPVKIQDLDVINQPFDKAYLRYNFSQKWFEHTFICEDMVTCISTSATVQQSLLDWLESLTSISFNDVVINLDWTSEIFLNWNLIRNVESYDGWVLLTTQTKSYNFTWGWVSASVDVDWNVTLVFNASWVGCSDIINCVEWTTNLDLSNVIIELGEIWWKITFTAWATIDWTNTTNTGIQNFDSNYVANYDWSEINYNNTDVTYVWGNVVFDNTTNVQLSELSTINWEPVATTWDIVWMSNWKKSVRLATTVEADLTWFTYVPGNEPSWDIWTWVLSAPTIDSVLVVDQDRILIKNSDSEKRWNWLFYYSAADSSFKRTSDANNLPTTGEVASMMVWVIEWTINTSTIYREIHTNPITLWTDDIEYTIFAITVSTEDKYVKISATDIVEKYLQDAVWNTVWAASNSDCIKYFIQNPWANENMLLWLDLTSYTWNVEIVWTTTLNNLNFSTWTTIDRTNTTNTGTQNFNSNYVADYNLSQINYTDVTENREWDNIINLTDGSSITNNFDWDVNNNYGDTYTENNIYIDWATINNTWNVNNNYNDYVENNVYTWDIIINNTSTPVLLWCDPAPDFWLLLVAQTDSQYALVTIGADEYKVLSWADQNLTWVDYVVSAVWTGDDLILTIVSWTPTLTSVCWYNWILVVNNNNTITNNDWDIINNSNVTEIYSDSHITYDNTTNINFEWDTNITNLEVTNLTITWWGLVANVITDKADQIYNGTDLDRTLSSTPLSEDALHITTDSGTNLILWVDYSIANNIITWIILPTSWEHLYVRWLIGQTDTVPWGQAYYEEFVAVGGETIIPLTDTPAGANWIWVSTESSLYGKQWATRDWTYNAATNSIVMNYTLWAGDIISIQYLGFVAMSQNNTVLPVVDTTGTVNANASNYILVTYTGWDTTINLPDANTCNGAQIRVKKFTGEDVLVTTISPFWTQLIDWYALATMNINRTMYTLTAINGNWYLWD